MDPWSKGDYSRHIREASMVVRNLPEVKPPSGRVPGRGLLVLPIFGARRQRNREVFHDAGSSRGFLQRGVNIGRRGAPEVGPTSQAPWWRGQGWGRATWPPRTGVAPL